MTNPDWWRGAVIYQIYPRSFLDSNGDGIGDLPGILKKLDYVTALGVDAIWVSPFFTSPMRDFGYDISDFCGVAKEFGTLADFDTVLDKAHQCGLKVIIDQIYSHTSDEHKWFQQSRTDADGAFGDWYVWADAAPGGGPPNNWQSFFYGPAWTWSSRRKQYYMHNFLPSQPDLNLWNTDVQDAILDSLEFWLKRGVDGVRLDAISHYLHQLDFRDNPPRAHLSPKRPADLQYQKHNCGLPEVADFLARIRATLDKYDARCSIGEIGGNDPFVQTAMYANNKDTLNTAYNFSFLFMDDFSPGSIRTVLEDWHKTCPDAWPTMVFSNHDCQRVATRWGGDTPDPQKTQMMIALLLSLRGSVCMYQGEELGLPHSAVPFERLVDPEGIVNWPMTFGRDGARTPMPWEAEQAFAGFSSTEPWLPVEKHHVPMSVDRQETDAHSTLNFTRQFLKIRASHEALRLGDMTFEDMPRDILGFKRQVGLQSIICMFNLGPSSAKFAVPEAFTFAQALGGLPQNGKIENGRASIPAYGFVIAENINSL